MIKVLLVDDFELVRTGFEYLLKQINGLTVVGVTGLGTKAIDLIEQLSPDVVLMDIDTPGVGGIEASRKLYQKYPEIKIVALSVHTDGPLPNQLLRSGVRGFISKRSSVDELVNVITKVYHGNRYLCSEVANHLALSSMPDYMASPFEKLSQRELQVTLLTLQGKSNQEIADTLIISVKTVNTYRYRIHLKIGVRNDVELTRLAIKYKVIEEAVV